MAKRRVRIGIDVGGTFTDAVAIDNETLAIRAQVKVKTTHDAPRGVAEGVIAALHAVLDEGDLDPSDVGFIAHGTTQATNALLEGDVVTVGTVGMGSGLEAMRAKSQCRVEDMQLSQGHVLETRYSFLPTTNAPTREDIETLVEDLIGRGSQAVVAAEAYSVDDPRNERRVMEIAREKGVPACGTHEISKRYGLKRRTRTAVINASILPKMVRTANMTQQSVEEAGISAPLMIMRGDGGAMSIDEMRSRPILTLLSGPAAGVAGALMYARISDGVFLEVGGTSTDISAIRNGHVEVDYAAVGGHRTYLTSLDVRTVGLAGGSMIRLRGGKLAEVGPRSAHIAGLTYAVYADPEEIEDPKLEIVRPKPEDPEEYVVIRTASGSRFALTLSGAANIAGLVPDDDYAAGNTESARRAFQPLAVRLSMTVEDLAVEILKIAIDKVIPPVRELMEKYDLDASNVVLVGGGGGAGAVVPFLAKTLGYRHQAAPNAQVISTIGVALAMVRDMVERTIASPTEDDVLRVRREAEDSVISMGAVPETVSVTVEIDAQRNLVRAIATGALEMRAKDLREGHVAPEERRRVAADSFGCQVEDVERVAETDQLEVYVRDEEIKRFLGLFTDRKRRARVVDKDGIVRLKLSDATVDVTTRADLSEDLAKLIADTTVYGDAGPVVPSAFLLQGGRISDLTGLATRGQIVAIAEEELRGVPGAAEVVMLTDRRR